MLCLLPFNILASGFVVESISLSGNKKISDGTVFSYLGVQNGDFIDDKKAVKIIKDLYETGFFNAIEVHREDQTLLIKLDERPSIFEIKIIGNEDIEAEILDDALNNLGISKGKLFNRSVLDKIEQELKQLYYSMGKYSVTIESKVESFGEGLVAISLIISEGVPAKVRDINITGNTVFSDDDLLDEFTTTIPSQSFFGSSDDYSAVKMSGDIEGVKARYNDVGYLDFKVDSSQVTISPDRKDINVAINVFEGEQFKIQKVELSGEFVVPEDDLRMLISVKEGDIFSRKQVSDLVERLSKRLGESGYAFANINAIPTLDKEKKLVDLNFFIDPGQKMHVRYINFQGNEKTADHVLRRELRQLESAPFSASKVERSKVRLQRLKYVSGADIKFVRVNGEPDQMDLVVAISERFSGNFSIGLGYSEEQGALINLGLAHDNIFGSGKRVSVNINNSDSEVGYAVSYVNPYHTADGVSRGISFRYAETDASGLNISSYILDQGKISVNYGFPLSEYNTLNFNVGLQTDRLALSDSTADEVFDFIVNNNDDYDGSTDTSTIDKEVYDTYFVSTSFSLDTRNRTVFPDRGYLHRISLELFGGDLDYYKVLYRGQFVHTLNEDVTLSLKSRLAQGNGFNDTTDLPFYEKFFAGGVRTVRGYDFNTLGPEDSNGTTFGGNYQAVFNAEALFKVEALGDPKTFRLALFYDAGNVFAESSDVSFSGLRSAVGVAAMWFSPFGPLEFSYAEAINDKPGDDTKGFQFSLGSAF